MKDVLLSLYDNQQFGLILSLILANLVLGIVASLKRKDFQFIRLGDWLMNRCLPMAVGYGVAAGLTQFAPTLTVPGLGFSLPAFRDIGFVTLLGVLGSYLASNFTEIFGVELPKVLAKDSE